MAPKAAPVDHSEAVDQALSQTREAAGLAKAAAFDAILALFGEPETLALAVAHAAEIAAEAAGVLAEVAAMAQPTDDEAAAAHAKGVQLLTALCDAGAATTISAACLPPLLAVIATPAAKASRTAAASGAVPGPAVGPEGAACSPAAAAPPVPPPAWRSADLTESRVALLTSACTGLCSLAAYAEGRIALRRASALPPLLALLQPVLAEHAALQAQAALTLAHLAESPLCRASLRDSTTRPALLGVLTLLQAPAVANDAHGLRLRAKLLLLLGFCLYDGALLPSLLSASLLTAALTLLDLPTADGEAEPPSAEALQCAAELRANAASVLAIGCQYQAGRDALCQAGGLDRLAASLSAIVGVEPLPAGDAAAAAVIANIVLAVAHAALDGDTAAVLAANPSVIPSLVGLLQPAPEDAVVGWAAVRGNACTALAHLAHVPSGRATVLTMPMAAAATDPDAAAAAEDADTLAEESKTTAPAADALATLVAILNAAAPAPADGGDTAVDQQPDAALIAAASNVLHEVAGEEAGRLAIVAAGGIEALLPLLSAVQQPNVLEAAASAYAALVRAAAAPDCSQALVQYSAEPRSDSMVQFRSIKRLS